MMTYRTVPSERQKQTKKINYMNHFGIGLEVEEAAKILLWVSLYLISFFGNGVGGGGGGGPSAIGG